MTLRPASGRPGVSRTPSARSLSCSSITGGDEQIHAHSLPGDNRPHKVYVLGKKRKSVTAEARRESTMVVTEVLDAIIEDAIFMASSEHLGLSRTLPASTMQVPSQEAMSIAEDTIESIVQVLPRFLSFCIAQRNTYSNVCGCVLYH